jgi:glycosyltransferase involved in cell wall biosynthesis
MRIGYFSPLQPEQSGISDYSEELLPALAQAAEIDLFVDGFTPTNHAITSHFNVLDYRKQPALLDTLGRYDTLVCHMGNSHRYHRGIYEVATRFPAIVVFHDFAFQHFFLERSRELRDHKLYLDELAITEGLKIRAEAEEALSRGAAPPQYQNPLGFPMNYRLANHAAGIIAHSEWTCSRLARAAPGIPVARINHHVKIPEANSHRATTGPISIASFGFITASKGLESAIRALAALKSDHSFTYTLIGEPDNYFDVEQLARDFGMQDRVSITGYVSFEEFNRRITQTDIAINLRDQTVGETSGSLCRLLAAGVPTLVSNIGWFSELPDTSVIKIDPGQESDLLVSAYLKELIENAELRQRIGDNARRFMLANHTVEQTAGAYIEFIRYVVSLRTRRHFIDSISVELANLSGAEPDELMLDGVARAISELVPRGSFE